MEYREHAPPPELAPFVACLWEITEGGGSHRVLPDGAMDLLFARGDRAARLVGPMTKAILTEDGAGPWVVGVRCRPGAGLELLGLAPRELLDDVADAGDAWGAAGRTLGDRLAYAESPGAARSALTEALRARTACARLPDRRITRAVAALKAARGELPLPAVAAGVGLSDRQLLRLFVERVGYRPKLFARVARLEAAVAAIAPVRGSIASWASLAAACGYADQAHLIREFVALTGVTPTVYARARAMSEIDNTSAAEGPSFPA